MSKSDRGLMTPILMLTARGELRERVLGLETGADDYLVKPFEIEELLARARALLRRASTGTLYRCGDLEIDRTARRALLGGTPLDLTNREVALLLHLAQRVDQVVPKSEILARVWDMTFDPGSDRPLIVGAAPNRFADLSRTLRAARRQHSQ